MKNISILLASLLLGTTPILSEEVATSQMTEQKAQSTRKLGADFVRSVRSNYENGTYKNFLSQMDQDYAKAKSESELSGLIAIRQEDALIASQIGSEQEQWNSLTRAWTQERNQELLNAVKEDANSLIAQKVASATSSSSEKEEKAVETMISLRGLTPGQGKNSDENQLIAIDLEYEYKQIHLDAVYGGKWSSEERAEKHLALRMEQMDRMVAVSQSFEDQELKQMVALLAETADARYARGIDLKDLYLISRGRLAAENETEKKVGALLSSFEGKFTDLTKNLFQQTLQN